MNKNIRFEIKRTAKSLEKSVFVYEPEQWLEWVRKEHAKHAAGAKYVESIQPWNLKQAAYELAAHYLDKTAGGIPAFAIPAMLQGEDEGSYYRAVAIWSQISDATQH